MPEATTERLALIFRAVLELREDVDVTEIRQAGEPRWDSLAHVVLVGAVESEFGVQIDAGDSLDLTSYAAVAAYLRERGL